MYTLDQAALRGTDVQQSFPTVDTLLLPAQLEAVTAQARIVDRLLPQSHRSSVRREERLN